LIYVRLEKIMLEGALDDAAVKGQFETFLDDDTAFDEVLHRCEQLFVNILYCGNALVELAGQGEPLPERSAIRPTRWPPSPFLEFGLGAGAAAAAPDSMVWSEGNLSRAWLK
jgi:hypothetical protein